MYTQQYFGTVSCFSVDDILFMDESSVHINYGVRKYGSAWKGYRAIHFSKHWTGCNYTPHLIAGLHGKMHYEITSGASKSVTFVNFIHMQLMLFY